jgi:hemerythrin
MDRASIAEYLRKAERHVDLGREHVHRQREIVSELERDGHDATLARELLEQFERALADHVSDRDRLVNELATAP